MKLWELSHELEFLDETINNIEDSDLSDSDKETLIQDTFNQWLDTSSNFDDKALNVASFIRHCESVAEARKAEAKRLSELAKQSERKASRLRTYLSQNMTRINKTKIEGVSGKVSLRKQPAVLQLKVEPQDLPDKYKRVTVAENKTALRELCKAQPDNDLAELVDLNIYSLTIK